MRSSRILRSARVEHRILTSDGSWSIVNRAYLILAADHHRLSPYREAVGIAFNTPHSCGLAGTVRALNFKG